MFFCFFLIYTAWFISVELLSSASLSALTSRVWGLGKWCPGCGGGPVRAPALPGKTSHPPPWTSPGGNETNRWADRKEVWKVRKRCVAKQQGPDRIKERQNKEQPRLEGLPRTSLESLVKRSPPLRKSRIRYNFPSVWNATKHTHTHTGSFNQRRFNGESDNMAEETFWNSGQ